MQPGSKLGLITLITTCLADASAARSAAPQATDREPTWYSYECGYLRPSDWLPAMRRAIESGEIPDPRTKVMPPIAPRSSFGSPPAEPCVTWEHIHPYEDSAQVLLKNFSASQLLDLMADASNDLMSVHGNNFDFVARGFVYCLFCPRPPETLRTD